MRVLPAVIAVLLTALPAMAQNLDIDSLAGVYKHKFQNGSVDGDKYVSEDIMEIVKLAPDRAYLRLALNFFNGHSCSFWGVVHVAGDSLVHRSNGRSGEGCELSLRSRDGKLILDDKDGHCRAYGCGARGTFTGTSFPLTSRRDIRYLDRLKASSQFKEALDEDAPAAR
ncbi:hypothetical protein CCC_01155 [Paramagnetospirillum magnetotacticum MS-1]|uniref:Uncharacterized protein n=1 Tax=Paramagnetospirillum magnetotacticum MS-1 TaxID=272627 RepID=A0A0C2YEJ1_PARME|nr:hypothetical protein [Paramagnetospirillum magnetotacticum]KIL98094.1 hypothetical protein CCC_01155 [Paramagnetospirillum magnetotacticum MS-1]